jgi:hypothetical protein
MKKLLSIVAIAGFMSACNDNSTKSDTTTTDSAVTTPVDTLSVPADTSSVKGTNTTMKDGLMTLKDGKMMIMKNGAWEVMKEPMTCTNGRKVSLKGEVSKGDKKRKMTEGMMIDKDGQMMDKDGKMMDTSGWE